MADYESRHPENVPGAFFTDDTCIICGMCSELAPNVFMETEDHDHSFVYHQPQSAEDLEQAEEAMESCPTESIGKVVEGVPA